MTPTSNNNSDFQEYKVIDYAKLYIGEGLSVIPLKPRSKEPLLSWKDYQGRLPNEKEIEKWFSNTNNNIGIVCGNVSGNLIVLDFDTKEKAREFYEKAKNLKKESLKIAIFNTWWVKTGKGIHIYLRVNVDKEKFKEMFRTKVRLAEGVDIKAEGGYVVAPPSIHPNGANYKFIQGPKKYEIQTLTPEEFEEILKLLKTSKGGKNNKTTGNEGRTNNTGQEHNLTKEDIQEIVNALKGAYNLGHRDWIVFYLTGWFKKANVSYESARKVIEKLAEDDEEINNRLFVLDRTYRLKGNLSYKDEKLKGKSGLQEVLEEIVGEEKALDIIRIIEEKLGAASPYRDSIVEIMDYERQIYAVANLRKMIVVTAQRIEQRTEQRTESVLKYKKIVCTGAPTKLVVYKDPLGGPEKYEVTWEVPTRGITLKIGPAFIDDIIGRLKNEGLVRSKALVEDVISTLFEGFIKKGKAEITEEIDSPGFYLVDDKLITVRWEAKETEGLNQALEVLNELAQWYGHAVDRFATTIKWGLISPFIYAMKQKGRWIPWLYLYGSSKTGKTTLGEIVLNIWGLGGESRKTGASIDTPARIGYVLSQSTFPVLVNEPGNAIVKEEIVEIMKNAIETTLVRGKYQHGTYTEIPSLAPLIMASNRMLPRDDALLRRLIVLRFTYGDRIEDEKAKQFEREVKPKLRKLQAIGQYVAKRILDNPNLLVEMEWNELATQLLIDMYNQAGLQSPEWIGLTYDNDDENVFDSIQETIRTFLIKRINEEFTRFVGRVTVNYYEEDKTIDIAKNEIEFRSRVETVLRSNLLPWAILRDDYVLFTTALMDELRPLIGDIGGLKSIAELLGWEYRRNTKVGGRNIQAIQVHLDNLLEFLSPQVEE